MADGARRTRILLVDDHRAIAQAVASSLRAEELDVVVADMLDREAVIALAADVHPDVALVDLHLGPDLDGRTLIEPLRAAGTAVIVLSGLASDDKRGDALRLGAVAVLDKAIPFDELVTAIRQVLAGDWAMRPADRDALLAASSAAAQRERRRAALFDSLTSRERAVLDHLLAGRVASDIAAVDGVKVSTVRSQIGSILTKLGVSSQQAAIALAVREGYR